MVIAVFLMPGAVALLAVLPGAVTSAFVTRAEVEMRDSGEDPVIHRLDELCTRVEALREELARLQGDERS